jgi:hypothetical protein
MPPTVRFYLAWVLLVSSLVLWPVSVFTFAADEPATVLGLSWLAITLTALDVLATSDVRRTQDDDDG